MHHPGCCLEHAHLHILPLPDSVDDDLGLGFKEERLDHFEELGGYASRSISYLLYLNREDHLLAYHVDENLPSQFLRREFCQRLGALDHWDWAVFPFRDAILRFLERYSTEAAEKGWNSYLE